MKLKEALDIVIDLAEMHNDDSDYYLSNRPDDIFYEEKEKQIKRAKEAIKTVKDFSKNYVKG